MVIDVIERDVDDVLADSFPASDPPSWTPAVVETRPRVQAAVEPPPVEASGRPRWIQVLGSAAALLAVVWAVPLFVVALPLALVWRAVLALSKWRTA